LKYGGLLWIIPAIFLAGCATTAAPVTANNPHPDLPANYRQKVAEFMRTQFFARTFGIKNAEISDPNRTFSGLVVGGDRDVVCVRLGATIRAYVFKDGVVYWDSGGIISQMGRGVLNERWSCGANPNFKPFPEADYQPRPN
jgi:hypothetical protein